MSLNITDAIFFRAEQQPQAVALIDPGRIVDYRTLCGATCLAAQRFRQAGWKAGDTVGISLREDPVLYLVSALALARMGVAQTAVPASEPAPLRRARIERSGLCGLVADGSPGDIEKSMVTVVPEPDWLKIAAASAAVDDIREPGGERLWCITETSGTTATPKRIGISHAVEELRKARVESMFSHRPGERFLNLTGIRYLSALRRAICCLGDGGTVTFPPGFATGQLLDWIALHHVTYIICVPMHLHQLLHDIRTDGPRLPALRILRSGTGALSPSAVQEVRRRISPNLYVSYGANESGNVAVATPTMLDTHPDTVGHPLPGVEVGVVDDEDRPVADGVAGHFRVRGPGVLTSYLGAVLPEHARMFRNGWFYPGDVGLRNGAGLLFHKGRSDEVMNFDGILVGPAEIESVLRQHPAVTDVAAFALPSPEHQHVPAAAFISSQRLSADELKRFCAERLGIRSPRVFMQIDAIPRNAMGKILRNRLVELALQNLREPGLSS